MYKAADNKAAISKAADNVALMLNVNTGRPLQVQLFEQVRAMIIDGLLTSGTPLPATRALSEQLGISRNTVVLAYDRLLTEGYIESKRSIGTFVSEALPEISLKPKNDGTPYLRDVSIKSDDSAAEKISESLTDSDAGSITDGKSNLAPPTEAATAALDNAIGVGHSQIVLADIDLDIDFYPGAPDVEAFPVRTWRRILNRKLLQFEDYFHEKTDILGLFELRRAISEHLGPARGILTNTDEVVIVSNEQEARSLLCQLLLPEGAPAVVESPGLDGMSELFSHYKTDVYGIPTDQDGMLTDELPSHFTNAASNMEMGRQGACSSANKPVLGMAYVTPSHHFPLGGSMALPRRLQLLEWAKTFNMMIVEDDSTSDFRYNGSPLTALKGLDNRLTGTIDKTQSEGGRVPPQHIPQGNVIYLGGFMKSLGIELGYLVVPTSLIPRLKRLKSLAYGAPSWLEQATLSEFIDNGAYDRHLRKLRKKCKEKRDLLISLLKDHFGDDTSLSSIEGGLHLIWHLPENFGTADFVSNLMKQKHKTGLYTVQSGGAVVVSDVKFDKQALIFGFSSLTLEDIEDGVNRLARELNGKA